MEFTEKQITVHFTVSEIELLISHLDGLIYSLGFDQDENLIKLYDEFVDLINFKNKDYLQ
ncbi:hypothetical protein H7992_21945 [Sporosarcina sp. resist]|uniref:hypothetical protein n=1 Tax=unclassified Sporosarcina TaxID=2647733 RepID=UPI00164EBA64|nr:hypothetical protein [Sporosarcina sp. resist]QNK87795.1 hypothetical protein H7992_21945 [Sporosarcina sp. resist]